MTRNEAREELIKKRAEYLFESFCKRNEIGLCLSKDCGKSGRHYDTSMEVEDFNEEATVDTDWFLSLKGPGWRIAVVETESKLPKVSIDSHTWSDYTPDMAHELAQQDMLKVGYVKEVKEG